MMFSRNRRQGSALIAIIMVLSMLSIIGGGILWATTTNVKGAVNSKEYKISYYRGETAVNIASDALKKSIDKLYNEMKDNNQITMDAESFIVTATTNAKEALPADIKDSISFVGFVPEEYEDNNGNQGYSAVGSIEFLDATQTISRRVGVNSHIKIMPLIRPSQVTNVLGPISFPNSAAILSGGNFEDGGKFVYLYNGGKIYLNEDGLNIANGEDIFEYDKDGNIIGVYNLEVKKGDGEIIPMDMSSIDWLGIDYWSNVTKFGADIAGSLTLSNASNSDLTSYAGNNYIIDGDMTINAPTKEGGINLAGATFFVNGNLRFNFPSGGKNVDLNGARFFVGGSTTMALSGGSKPFDENCGFDNSMIISNGSINVDGKPDNLYTKAGPASAMYMYTKNDINITGANASDVLNAVIYAKNNVNIASQVNFEGQIICEGTFIYCANSNPTMEVTYNESWVESFYNSISLGLGGIIPPNTNEVVIYGDPIIDTTQIPYVTIGRVIEFSS